MGDASLQPQFVRTPDAARFLSISPRTLEKLRVTGGGPPYFKRGRAVLYAITDLGNWLQAGRRQSTSDPGATSSRVADYPSANS